MKTFQDGDRLCVTRDDFINLQESPAYFLSMDSPMAATILRDGLLGLPLEDLSFLRAALAAQRGREMKDDDGNEIVIERDGSGKPIEPRCPLAGCRTMVDRPKCLFEFGSDCPRHPYRLAYKDALKKWIAAAAKENRP